MIVDLYHWSRLELRHVVALQTIVEAGSFWAAADRLDTSQSALSQQIAALDIMPHARLKGHVEEEPKTHSVRASRRYDGCKRRSGS